MPGVAPRWTRGALALFVVGAAVTVVFGRLLLDEGWYLYAAQLVRRGAIPYRDFLFTQTPLTAYLLAPVTFLGAGMLLGGRLLCAALGVVGVLWLTRAAARGVPGAAATWVVALLAAAPGLCFDVSTVRTAAPGCLLVAGALAVLVRGDGEGAYARAAALLSLGVCVRLSVVPLLGVVAVLGVLSVGSWRERARVVAAAALPAGVVLGGFALVAGGRFWFDTVQYHSAYYGQEHAWPLPPFLHLFVREVAQTQGVALLVGLVAAVVWVRMALGARRRGGPLPRPLRLAGACFLGWGAMTLLQATRTAPYATHQTIALPVLAVAVALTLAGAVPPRWARGAPLVVYALGLALAALGPHPWRWSGHAAPLGLLRTGAETRAVARGRPILTFDPLVAVAAGSPVWPGYELGMFSYGPLMRDAARRGLKDAPALLADLRRRPAVVALTARDIGFLEGTPGGPAVVRELRRDYLLAREIPRYGQFEGVLMLLVPRE